jgi:transcriptional regulator with XRE-family HTH domain
MTLRSPDVTTLYSEAASAFDVEGEAATARSRVDRIVGTRIGQRRRQLGKGLTELARALDVSPSQMRDFESGAKRVGANRLVKLARDLDVSPAYFFEDNPDGSPTKGGGDAPDDAEEKALNRHSADAQTVIARSFSGQEFYDRHFRAPVERMYPKARLFSLYVPADSIVVQPSGQFFASGVALISAPAKTRKGAHVEASLSLPLRLSGTWRPDALSIEKAELAPIEAHYPPDLALRLRAPQPRRRSPAAA